MKTVATRLRKDAPEFFGRLEREGLSGQRTFPAFVALFPDVFEMYGAAPRCCVILKS